VAVRKPSQYQRVSLLLAVSRASGVVGYRLVKGSVSANTFLDFLRSLPLHKNVLLDNASIHRAHLVRDHCIANGIQLRFTPPYCPWYNPVEYTFSKIKGKFRRLRVTGTDFMGDVKLAVEAQGKTAGCFEHAKRLWDHDRMHVRGADEEVQS
jgi:transposase